MKSALRLLTDLLLAPPITHSAVEVADVTASTTNGCSAACEAVSGASSRAVRMVRVGFMV